MSKAKFHHGIFFSALKGLIGREPDRPMVQYGNDGFYHYIWLPKNAADRDSLINNVNTIREWMEEYDIKHMQWRCEFGPSRTGLREGKDLLEVIIYHRVDSQTDEIKDIQRKLDMLLRK